MVCNTTSNEPAPPGELGKPSTPGTQCSPLSLGRQKEAICLGKGHVKDLDDTSVSLLFLLSKRATSGPQQLKPMATEKDKGTQYFHCTGERSRIYVVYHQSANSNMLHTRVPHVN